MTSRTSPWAAPTLPGVAHGVLVLVAVAACASDAPDASAVSRVDSSGVAITTVLVDPEAPTPWSLASDPELVITGEGGQIFGDIQEVVWMTDGTIVFEDGQTDQLYVYDANGQFVVTVGEDGDGPGEFRFITTLSAVGDTVFAFDSRHRRLSVVHAEAGYVRALEFDDVGGIPAQRVWAATSDRFVSYRMLIHRAPTPSQKVTTDGIVSVHDRSGRVVAGPFIVPGPYSSVAGGDAGLPFSNHPVVAVAPGRTAFSSGQSYELAVLDGSFALTDRIRWPTRESPIEPSEIERVTAAGREALEPRLGAERFSRIVDAWSDPAMLPDARPAMGLAFFDDSGRIWVSDFEPRIPFLAIHSRDWHVLSPSGVPAGRLYLPEGVRLAAVRDGMALLLVRDALDIQRIEVRALRTGS